VEMREERQRVNEFRRAPLLLLKVFRQLGDVAFSDEPRPVSEDFIDGGQIADFVGRPVETLEPSGVAAEVEKVARESLRQRCAAHARHGHDADVRAVGERKRAVAR